MKVPATVVNCLSLLASKVAPHVFDLSSGQFHVSLRDQIVRARLLVQELLPADSRGKSLLIIGAGAAGIAAAVAATHRGARVILLEAEDAPMFLQSKVNKRYVGPFMYEWPWRFSGDQTYPPTDGNVCGAFDNLGDCPLFEAKHPLKASEFARAMVRWLNDHAVSEEGSLHVATSVKGISEGLKDYVVSFAESASVFSDGNSSEKPKLNLEGINWWKNEPSCKEVVPDYIVLAAGMGDENVSLPRHDGKNPIAAPDFCGKRFWEDDDLQELAGRGEDVVIVGGGDGALQDALRALTADDHPLALVQRLFAEQQEKDSLEQEMEALRTIEAQARLQASWTLDGKVWAALDGRCKEIAGRLAEQSHIRQVVLNSLRKSSGEKDASVTLLVRENFFDKAYLLNRFLVHLIDRVLVENEHEAKVARCVRFRIEFSANVIGVEEAKAGSFSVHFEIGGTMSVASGSCVAVRFGINKDSIPGLKMISLTGEEKAMRTSFSHVPLPFLV